MLKFVYDCDMNFIMYYVYFYSGKWIFFVLFMQILFNCKRYLNAVKVQIEKDLKN